MNKKKLLVGLGAAAVGGAALVNVVFAAGLLHVQADLAPFRWSVGGKAVPEGQMFDNGTTKVPGSLNYKGTTYIPIRMLAEQLGLEVEWKEDSHTAMLADSSTEDPMSDQTGPVKTADYGVTASLKSAADLLEKPESGSKAVASLKSGASVKVLGEFNRQWIQVAYGGRIGYITPGDTNYVLKADRPAWEQKADGIISLGLKYLGAPYDFDAPLGQTDTFDCSSFVNYLYGAYDIQLKRNSREQSKAGTEVALDQLRKGDLIFFTTPKRKNNEGVERIGHVAIYLGEQKLLHTYRVGIGVTVTEMDDSWKQRIVKATRIIPG